MSASAFFVVIVLVIGVALSVVITPILLIPVVLIVLSAVIIPPIVAKFGGASAAPGPGTPSTSEASYNPVVEPTMTPRGSE